MKYSVWCCCLMFSRQHIWFVMGTIFSQSQIPSHICSSWHSFCSVSLVSISDAVFYVWTCDSIASIRTTTKYFLVARTLVLAPHNIQGRYSSTEAISFASRNTIRNNVCRCCGNIRIEHLLKYTILDWQSLFLSLYVVGQQIDQQQQQQKTGRLEP